MPSANYHSSQNSLFSEMTFEERFRTFEGFWDNDRATALQLAALGHVYDRPPLEALEEGTRCISCSAFVRSELSIQALQGHMVGIDPSADVFESFHMPKCVRQQVRMPLDPRAPVSETYDILALRAKFERKRVKLASTEHHHVQQSSLFSLPTEVRLIIYAMVLPRLDSTTEIVRRNQESNRVATLAATRKQGPRDMTKINLLATCSIVHSEALDLLFTNTTYNFQSTRVMYLFLRHIGHDGRELLKSIEVTCGTREDAIAFALLASCPKLIRVTFRLPRSLMIWPGAPLWISEAISCILALSGMEEVHFAKCERVANSAVNGRDDVEMVRRELMRSRDSPNTLKVEDLHGKLNSWGHATNNARMSLPG